MLFLVAFGFRRYFHRDRKEAMDYLGIGIWMLASFQILRLLFWDITPEMFDFTWSDIGVSRGMINWVFNALICIGCWFKLKGYWLLVNKQSPGKYNILTAVFYPHKLWGNKDDL